MQRKDTLVGVSEDKGLIQQSSSVYRPIAFLSSVISDREVV